MMPKAKTSRKQLFKAALAIAGLTGKQWAEGEGITPQWLSMVLSGKEVSGTLTTKIDAFIAEHLPDHHAALSA